MLTITQIKRIMSEGGLRPNKKLGQNFLIDKNIADKIIKAADFKSSDVILEIGSGLGNMTSEMAGRVGRIMAVEFDKGLCGISRNILNGYPNVELICANILKFDFGSFAANDKIRVVGNLPYYITTPILERIIENRGRITDALLMVQKEVAQRMLTGPGNKDYGSLSCYIEYYTRPKFKMKVKRTSFFPAPEVDSIFIHLDIAQRPPVPVEDEKLLFKVIRGSFNQRRKTILSSLANKAILNLGKKDIEGILKKAGVSPQARPESLSLREFARITDEFTRWN